MSNFDNENEFYTPQEPPLENPDTAPPTEENTTYHYAYRKPEEPQSEPWQNPYYNPPRQSSYYEPPQQTAYQEPSQQSEAHITSINGAPINETQSSFYAPKKKKNRTVTFLVSLLAACLIFSFVGIFVSMVSSDPTDPESNGNSNSNSNTHSQVELHDQAEQEMVKADGTLTVVGVSEKCVDSCVGITVYTKKTNYNNFYGFNYGSDAQSGEEVASGEGSGVLMLEDNGKTYVMTCAHVISDGTSFVVTLNDKTEYRATLVGYDAQTDIGVLAINETGLKIAEFADSDSTKQGEQIVAIGCPGGLQFLNSTTVGYVSALGRPISAIGYNMECIQVDAAINPGNSGGALLNMQGQVIGINSSKIAATEYEGMGFAVPSNTAVATANSLIRVGYVEGRAMIGITYKAVTTYSNSDAILSALAQLGYENATGTMVINEIKSESDLTNKGVKSYDMIVAVNGQTLTSTDIMTSTLSNSKPGDTIKLTIARIENNQIDTFEVTCLLIENKG